MEEMQDTSKLMQMFPDRAESCPMCGSDGDLISAMIRVKGGALGYYAGLLYICPACGAAWPMCTSEGKSLIDEWFSFDDFYEGIE